MVTTFTQSNSIRTKIVAPVALAIVAIVLFSTIYYPLKQQEQSLRAATQYAESLVRSLGYSVGFGLSQGNFSLIQTLFTQAKSDSDIMYLSILDEQNTPLIEHNPQGLKVDLAALTALKGTVQEKDVLKVSLAAEHQGKTVGRVVILYSLEKTHSEIANGQYLAIITGVVLLIIGCGVVFWVSNVVVRRIAELQAAAAKVSDGDLSVVIVERSGDELGVLANSFRKMVENIKQANEELVSEKQGVERKVEEALREVNVERNYLRSSVETMLKYIEMFAEGNLADRIPVQSDDDIGRLYRGYNRALEAMQVMVAQVIEVVRRTTEASADIYGIAEEIASGIQEQARRTATMSVSMDETAATVRQNTQQASVVAEEAAQASNDARHGGEVVHGTIEGINSIAAVVMKSADRIEALGKNSEQIGAIVQVIEEIADQTNLLALNAAIEAARAGEQGRGFAVVADEVRKLAERTQKATKEIAFTIKQIQNETAAAVQVMNQGTSEVEAGKQSAAQAVGVLERIIHRIGKVSDVIGQLASANEEQATTSDEIARNTESISKVTTDLAKQTRQIVYSADILQQITHHLQQLSTQFVIDPDAINQASQTTIKQMLSSNEQQAQHYALTQGNTVTR